MCSPNPSFLREKLRVGSSLPVVWCCARDGVYVKSVLQPFLHTLMWVFSHSPDREESLSWFLDFFQSKMLHL